MKLNEFDVTAASPTGAWATMYTDRDQRIPIVLTQDGVWSIEGAITCAERGSRLPNGFVSMFAFKAMIVSSGAGTGAGAVEMFDGDGAALAWVRADRVGMRRLSPFWAASLHSGVPTLKSSPATARRV